MVQIHAVDSDWMQGHSTGSTLLIAHTTALPKLARPDDDMHEYERLGRRSYVIQLNALMRELISSRPKWHLVDIEPMTAQFWPQSAYLRDAHHPQKFVSFNMLNIYLNLWREFSSQKQNAVVLSAADVLIYPKRNGEGGVKKISYRKRKRVDWVA